MSADVRLWEYNPWWREKESIAADDIITGWERSAIRYDPVLRGKIVYDYEPDNSVVYALMGPRQVGKTTLIKLQIREFLDRGVCPWNILYYLFDPSYSKSGLASVIEDYLRLSRGYRDESRKYLFLDEITSVDDWQRGIKFLYDLGRLKNCTILAAGSKADRILRARERLPGRRGRTADPYDRLLRPMRFAEFAGIRNAGIARFVRDHRLSEPGIRKKMILGLFSGEVPEEVDRIYVGLLHDLDDCLNEYMLTGGTPVIVDQKARRNFLPPELYAGYLEGILADWRPKDGEMLGRFAGAVAENLGSAISWNRLRRHARIGSMATVQDYALVLKDLPILSIIQRYGRKKRAMIRKEKKFYFADPFYLHMFNAWNGLKDPFDESVRFLTDANRGRMVEGIVANHLIRLAFSLVENRQMFEYDNNVFFWKGNDGRESDFVLYVNGTVEAPLEVRYRHNIDHRGLGGIASFLDATGTKSGLVLSKEELEARQDYLVVPASVFLMLV